MIGFLHFAVLDGELYVLAPSMPDWVNGLYFLTLAEIQEARGQQAGACACYWAAVGTQIVVRP